MDVTSVAFSPDGKLLASGSSGYIPQGLLPDGSPRLRHDGSIRLWNVDGQNQIGLLKAPVDYFVAFSPDGETLASAGWSGIYLWDVGEQKKKGLLKSPNQSITVAFSPDGSLLATGSYEVVSVWDVSEQKRVGMLHGHKLFVRHVAFSPDGKWLASEGQDGIVLLWEVNVQAGEIGIP